jgi:phosphohistidine phosphatase
LGCAVRYDDAMYAAGADDLLALARRLPKDVSSVMFVGHNPSMEEFTAMLCGVSPRYPTGALGTLELAVAHWGDTTPGCAVLTALVTPAQLTEEEADAGS